MVRFSVGLSFLLGLCLSLSGWASATMNESRTPKSKLILEKEVTLGGSPEAASRDGEGLFVSLMGPDTEFVESGDGSIRRLSWDGSVDASFNVQTPLHNPMGLAVIGDQIAVVDIDRVVLIQKTTGELSSEISLKSFRTRFLNDLTVVSDHQVVVSATDIKKLILVDIRSGEVKELLLDFELNQPNGLRFDPRTASLYISRNARHQLGNEGNGTVTRVEMDVVGGRLRHLWSTPIGKFVDGIDLKGNSVVVSDWVSGDKPDGAMFELDSRTGEVIARESPEIPGFADLIWDEDRARFAFVSLTGNKVLFYLTSK